MHEEFAETFSHLKRIMQEYEPYLVMKADEPGNYYLDAPPSEKYPKGYPSARCRSRKTTSAITSCLFTGAKTSWKGCRTG